MDFNLRNFFGKKDNKADSTEYYLENIEFSKIEMPSIKIERNKDWVSFGNDNCYPDKLIDYLNTSAIHNAIVLAKTVITSGKSVKFDGTSFTDYKDTVTNPLQQYNLNHFYNEPSGDDTTLEDFIYLVSQDWQVFGSYAIEIIWSVDFTRIASFRHIDVSKIRLGKMDEYGEVECYYYCRDWKNPKKNPPVEIYAYDTDDKEHYRQLLYVHRTKPGLEYYGDPGYTSALTWIGVDSQMGQFHLSNINNGFSPSMSIKFYKKPGSPEEKEEIVRGIMKQFSGTRNAGKAMVFFSDGKELAPDVTPIDVANLDKQFLAVADQVVQQIISAHRVTSPMLMGIALPGKLGYSNELESAWKIFDSTVVSPDQKIITKTLNLLARNSGVDAQIEIEKLNPIA